MYGEFEQRYNSLDYSKSDVELSKLFLGDKLNASYKYESARINYWLKSNEVMDVDIKHCEINPLIDNFRLNGDKMEVVVVLSTTIDYGDDRSIDTVINIHTITLIKDQTGFLIKDIDYTDEFKKYYTSYKDIEESDNNLDESYMEQKEKNQTLKKVVEAMEIEREQLISTRSVPGDSYLRMNSTRRNIARNYARTWSVNDGTHSGTSYNNSQFKYFSYQNDCQNFVSQCVWYGLGGRASSSMDKPMYSSWWANNSNTSSTWYWTKTSYFKNHIISNYNNNGYGLQGYEVSVDQVKVGDYIYVPGHVMFITAVNDYNNNGSIEYDEIEITAHTNNRKDKNLHILYSGQVPSDMEFIRIYGLKWNEQMQL